MNHSQTTCAWNGRRRAITWGASVSALALASAAFAGSAVAQTAPAQSDTPAATNAKDGGTVKEVVITGIRQSLRNAQAIKRDSDVFVDSVTAEDIGALPDRSVTEALQRIPGVAIDRFAAGRDPDHFSVEGSGVTVRGLTLTRSEFNGRDAFTANSGQGLSFADVPAELLGGVDVFKNNSADMIEGGISGVVNLKTRLPFDQTGQVISASIQDSYGDFVKRWAPTGTFLYTNRWQTPVGEFGFLASYTQSDLKTRSDGQQISNFGERILNADGSLGGNYTPGSTLPAGAKTVWFPRGAAFREDVYDHKRIGDAAAAQWRSPDHTMIATLQFLRSDSRQTWNEHAMEIATDNVANNGNSVPVQGTTVDFGSDGVFEKGVISSPSTGWRADLATDNQRTPGQGLQSNNIDRGVNSRDLTEDESFNFKWTPNEHWAFNLDVQHVQSHVTNLDAGLWASTYQNAAIQLNGGNIPLVSFLPPSLTGTVTQCPTNPPPAHYNTNNCSTYYNAPHNSFSDPYNSFPRAAMDHYENSDGVENSVRADLEYKFGGDGWLKSVRSGLRWAEQDRTTRFSTYNWGVISEQWGNNGPIWLDNPNIVNNFSPFTFNNFMRGQVPAPTGSQGRLFYTGDIASNYSQYVSYVKSLEAAWIAQGGAGASTGWMPLSQRPGVIPGTMFLPSEINPETETNKAAYLMAKYGHTFENGVKLSGNFGVRYVRIDREAQGVLAIANVLPSQYPNCSAAVPPGQNPPPFCTLSTSVQNSIIAFQNGANIPNNKSASFDYVLPSFNLKAEIAPGHIFRLGIEKSVAPPDFGLTRNYYNVALDTNNQQNFVTGPNGTTVQAPNVMAGNPMLKWTQALNFDVSYEWYFAKVGSLTFSLFDKELKDVVTNGTERLSFTNNGQTFSGVVTTPMNSPQTAQVRGFEIGYQQVYTFLPGLLSGLGMNANYTFVDSKGVPQSTLSETDPNVAAGNVANVDTSKLPLQGLSRDTFNVSPFYEKGPLSLRLAYNWRSRYLLTVRDVIVPFAPIMQESSGQLDGSAFWTVNKTFKVGIQAVNLTNSVTKTSSVLAVTPDLLTGPRSWFMNDRRFTLILRGTW